MKTLFILFATILSLSLSAQEVTKVSLQASGLTCSMCSNAINKALKTVAFVEKVVPNVQTSTFEITFRNGVVVDFDLLKKKVEDAGFFVSGFIATINFNNVSLTPEQPIIMGDKIFQFVAVKPGTLKGETAVKILNKGFVSSKEFKKNPLPANAGPKVYYATI